MLMRLRILNRVILSSDSALKFAIYLKGGIFVLCIFHKY